MSLAGISALGEVASGFASGLSGGPSSAGLTDLGTTVGGRVNVNVQPVNIGEMLRPFKEGSVLNGGFGLQDTRFSRFLPGANQGTRGSLEIEAFDSRVGVDLGLIGLAGIGVAAYFLLR